MTIEPEEIYWLLKTTTPAQEKALRMKYGVGCERTHTLWEIAQEFECSYIEARLLLKTAGSALGAVLPNHKGRLTAIREYESTKPWRQQRISIPSGPAQFTIASELEKLIREANISHRDLLALTSRQFEELIACVWDRLGYAVELTARTRDGGRDVIAVRSSEANVRYLIECKRYDPTHRIGVQFVRALYGVKVDDSATKAFLATTSTFTKDALTFFERHRWELEPRDYMGVKEWIRLARAKR